MKNILIPTDFSENAWNATKYALHLLEQEACLFHFLHTYTPTAYAYNLNTDSGLIGVESLQTEADMVFQNSQKSLRNILNKIAEHYPNPRHDYDMKSSFNILTDEINKMIEECTIDLVIMGTKGATGAQEILFGSNTLHVLKKANCPVLTIPDTFHFKYIDDILFPTDYKHTYTSEILKPVIELAKLNEAAVHSFHIAQEDELSDAQKANRDLMNECFVNIKHDFKDAPDTDIYVAIAYYINAHNISLLAMTRRKHSYLERLLFKQNISVIAMHLNIPFLVIPVK